MVLTTERPPSEPSRSSAVLDPQALIEEARRRQRRRYRRAGVCLLALAVLAATAVVGVDHLRRGPKAPAAGRVDRPLAAAVPATPKEMVAWMSDDRVVVLSSASGKILRTLAAPVLLDEPGLPDLAVSPAGMVYFDSASLSSFNTGTWGGADQIFEVPLAGGPVTHLAAGYDPQVSPNGRLLAFAASEAGQAPYLDAAGGIEIAHISPRGLTATRVLHPDARQLNQGLSQLSWSSDSRRLSFAQLDGDTDVTTFWTLPVDAKGTSLGAASQIPLRNPSLTWNGYWGRHRVDGRDVGLGVLTTADGTQRVVLLDPRTGRQLSTLFSVPGEVCVALSPTSPPMTAPRPSPCSYGFDNTVISDTGGGDVLLGGATSLNAGGGAGSAPSLYRWRMGTRRVIRLTPGALLATWGPA
jgi:hypothetical protein